MNGSVHKLSSNGLLAVLFFCWWVLNLLQASFTGLADDEAYYWYYASHLDWGYFDHPPVTALLVWLGSFFGGSLGIRFFITVLEPFALYIFWTLIRPENPSRRDVWLYAAICFSFPVAQLYGFIATPDAPLMFSVAVFFWAYSRFCRKDSVCNIALLGLSMALMAYSKYHGALVVILTLLSNPRLLKNPKFYLGGLLTLLLYTPHLYWQYTHDWVSFRYHLVGRNGFFELNNITDFLVNILLIFNPFFLWIYVRGWGRGSYTGRPLQKALYFNIAGFLLFFAFSSLRGYVQPQWVLPIFWGLIMTVFGYAREKEKVRRYVMRTCAFMAVLFVLVRIEAVFNPVGIRFEIFDNEESYGTVQNLAAGRPVIWAGEYSGAAKYRYYTGCDCWCQPNIDFRTSQWQFDDGDRDFTGREVLVQIQYEKRDSICGQVQLKNGNEFVYRIMDDFYPVRDVHISFSELSFPDKLSPGDVLHGNLIIDNPYPYDIVIDGDRVSLNLIIGRNKEFYSQYDVCPDPVVLPSFGTTSVLVSFTLPDNLQVAPSYGDSADAVEYKMSFVLKNGCLPVWPQSEIVNVTICH